MIRGWGGVVWSLVGAIALAVALQIMPVREVRGSLDWMGTPEGTGPRLSEILAGPARDWDGDGLYDSRSDEWVEVQNTGPADAPMEEYRITDADKTVRFAFTGTLGPGEIRLVTGSAAVAWQRSQGLTATGLSLNNTGDTVYLLRVAGTDTTVVDSHPYGSIEGGSDRSVGRADSDSEAWILFDALNRYTGGGSPPGTGCAPFVRLQENVVRTPTKPEGYPYHPVTFGQHLRRKRIDQGLSRSDLAARLGVHPETIRFWETGRSRPTVRLYPWVVAFLGYEVEDTPFTIGASARKRRMRLGLSQRALARLLDVAPSTIWRIESRRYGPDRRTLRKIRQWIDESVLP